MVSVWHQSTARAIRKHRIRLLSYRSRGTVMSYTDHSVQSRLKSNAPNGRKPRPILELPPRFGVPAPIWRSPGCSYTLLGACAWPEVNFRSVFVYRSGKWRRLKTQLRLKWWVMKLGSGCCAVGWISHTFIYLWRPTTISKLTDFPKGFVE